MPMDWNRARAQYQRDGYLIPDFKLPEETLAAICEAHERLVARYGRFVDYCPALLHYDLGFLNFARNPLILDMVEQIIGPDIILWNMSLSPNLPTRAARRPGTRTGNIGRSGLWRPAPSGSRWTIRHWRTAACG